MTRAVEVEPFSIDVPAAVTDDLRARLRRTRFVTDPPECGWDYGTDATYLRELVGYWADGFDWAAQQERLNQWRNLRCRVDGLEMHVVHARGTGPAPLPLMLVHGWPSGYLEMTKLIPLLTDPVAHGGRAEDAFDVVVPSLPGFGFSGPQPAGSGYHRAACALRRLLTEGLGYSRVGLHGTGLAPFVNGWLAMEHPELVAGYHTHDPSLFPIASFDPPFPPPSDDERVAQRRSASWASREGAYAELQRTKPLALGHALNDSPAGLAAWLVEKHRRWSDCGGEVERRYTKDELLTSFTIYWATGTIASSMRAYYERVHHDPPLPRGVRLPVPTGVAMPRYDPDFPARRVPQEWVRRTHDLRHWADLPRGGHFASWEEPALVVDSIRTFFRPLRASGG